MSIISSQAAKHYLSKHVPWWIARAASTTREAVMPGRFPRFDRVFPGVTKLYHVPPTGYPSEDAATMPIFYRHGDLRRRIYVAPQDFVTTLHDALLCPHNNVLLDRDGRVVRESVDVQLVAPLQLNGRVRELSGHWSLLRTPKGIFHYHITVDCLPRLLALNRPPFTELPSIKLFCPGPATDYERHMVSLLAPKNAEIVEVDPDGIYHPEHLIFTPLKTTPASAYLPPFYASGFRTRVLPSRPSTRSRRIYISRSNAKYRRIENEKALFDSMRPFGFELIRPEELSPEEEIETFFDSEIILGPHGAGMANALFADRTHLIELFSMNYVMPNFYFLAKSLGHSHHYFLGDGYDRFARSYAVDIDSVVRLVRRLVR